MPSPQSVFRPPSLVAQRSVRRFESRPGNSRSRNGTLRSVRSAPKAKTAWFSPHSAFLAAMLQKGHERNLDASLCRSPSAPKRLACRRKKGVAKPTQSTFGASRQKGPRRDDKKRAPERSLRGPCAWLNSDVVQNERTTCRRPLKPSALFWNVFAVLQPNGVA